MTIKAEEQEAPKQEPFHQETVKEETKVEDPLSDLDDDEETNSISSVAKVWSQTKKQARREKSKLKTVKIKKIEPKTAPVEHAHSQPVASHNTLTAQPTVANTSTSLIATQPPAANTTSLNVISEPVHKVEVPVPVQSVAEVIAPVSIKPVAPALVQSIAPVLMQPAAPALVQPAAPAVTNSALYNTVVQNAIEKAKAMANPEEDEKFHQKAKPLMDNIKELSSALE